MKSRRGSSVTPGVACLSSYSIADSENNGGRIEQRQLGWRFLNRCRPRQTDFSDGCPDVQAAVRSLHDRGCIRSVRSGVVCMAGIVYALRA
jgi:hypothetical protein